MAAARRKSSTVRRSRSGKQHGASSRDVADRTRSGAAAGDGGGAGGARPIWSGTISFGLVAVPVQMFPAVRSTDPVLRMLGPDGAPLRRRYVSGDGIEVPWSELVRGYEIGADEHVVLTDEELDSAAPRKSRDIDLRRFVPAASLDPMLFSRPYVLAPAGDSTKPYRLLAASMEREKKVGIATFVMRTKEYLVAVIARDGILWAETLRFADQVRTPKDVGIVVATNDAPSEREVAAMERTIRALASETVEREDLVEARGEKLRALAKKKLAAGEDVVEAKVVAPTEDEANAEAGEDTPDLFESIRRSLKLVSGDGGHDADDVRPSSPRRASTKSASAPRRRNPPKGPRRSRGASERSAS